MSRIQKYISEYGCLPRREIERMIGSGRITINGIIAERNSVVLDGDIVLIDGQALKRKKRDIYLLLNKPVGITCTAQPLIKDNIITFLDYPERVFPVGRLDKQSEGLIIMTNDGSIVNEMMREGNHEKEYIVTVDRVYTDQFIEGMANGVPILNQVTKRCSIERIDEYRFRIVLTQGLNRQIRRMAKYFGYNVIQLKRVRIMNLTLKGISVGDWRVMTAEELKKLKQLLKNEELD
ncbi:pseudouridine synthase [Bacillus solitudinis]|uniref:pseudouridine synthase n=1 Tax=Bacillus solitudinis TaxID=2014074 RepID=UPI000C23294E|nr:pseudouridine synthase [Bacillus solitudinis]